MPTNTEELVDRILDAWRILDMKEHNTGNVRGVPDRADIATLLDAAFFASIQKEEASFVTFSLMFLARHKDPWPSQLLSEFNRVLGFSDPVELSVESLRKLAGAVDERTSTLVVEKRGPKYLITGIAPFGRAPSMFGIGQSVYPRPEVLTISVLSPGSLLFSRGGSNLGRFSAGEFQLAQVTPFHSRALGTDLIARISTHSAFAQFNNGYWHWYSELLEHLLRSASGRGHGGTIIWIPQGQTETALGMTALGHALAPFPSLYEALLKLIKEDEDNNRAVNQVLDRHREGLADVGSEVAGHCIAFASLIPQSKAAVTTLANTIAQAACVDGATLIDEYFNPLKFGVRLTAPTWNGRIQPGPTPNGTSLEEIPRGKFGTRHNSAIDFVATVPRAIAFVISQDGPVRAITRRSDIVYLWPDCLSTMFVG